MKSDPAVDTIKKTSLKMLTRGALSIALAIISLAIFRGMSNILNALFIPLVIFIFTSGANKKMWLATTIALLTFCMILFQPQVFFVFFYCLLAALLWFLHAKNIHNLLILLFMIMANSMVFFIATVLTDYVFSTRILDITLGLMNGSILLYVLLLMTEGLVIAAIQIAAIMFIKRRLSKLRVSVSADRGSQ